MTLRSHDGLDLAVTSWPGPEPHLLFVHATGFCKELWIPVVEELRASGFTSGVTALDQRGHGDSGVHDPPFDWWDLGRDALTAAMASGARLGVGHSSGAAALAMAELLRPGTFDHLILIEPIAFPGPYTHLPDMPMAEAARRRKGVFDDVRHAERNFRDKEVFSKWDHRAMQAYVRHAFEDTEEGYVLKCSGPTEAEFYASGSAHGLWDLLDELRIPVTLVAGAESTTHHEVFLEAQAAQFRDVSVRQLDGVGHLVPMESPDSLAVIIAAAFQTIVGR